MNFIKSKLALSLALASVLSGLGVVGVSTHAGASARSAIYAH